MASRVFGIDFGTSSIKIYKKNEGVIFDEKNLIAICNGQPVAIGNEAFQMLGKAPDNYQITYPVKNGVIADIKNMLLLLNEAFKKIEKKYGKITGSEIIVATPTDITEVEQRAYFDLAANCIAKPRNVKIVNKPVACAIGTGIEIMNASGAMVVDIGANTTEISIMSIGGIVSSKLVPLGGNDLDRAIINNVRKKYNLIIGDTTAEYLKKELAFALEPEHLTAKIYGKDVLSGLPIDMVIDSEFVTDTIKESLDLLVDNVKALLEKVSPELSADIIDSGIFISGGSANIRKLEQLFNRETELDIHICEEPSDNVVKGLGIIIEEGGKYNAVAFAANQISHLG
ncbi:MAG: rod shape-determining protein [Lachnospiraceae bacterium]|nr:rod shape-determining protein [Lachnospiraceae bacterium]